MDVWQGCKYTYEAYPYLPLLEIFIFQFKEVAIHFVDKTVDKTKVKNR